MENIMLGIERMKTHLSRIAVKILSPVFIVWLFLFIFSPPMPDTPRARGMIDTLQREAHLIDGMSFSREELQDAVSRLSLNTSLNKYVPNIQYNSPTDWRVILIPEKRKTYANPCTFFYRISTLEFDKIVFPDILIAGGKENAQSGRPD
jgi:hypothetical protein